VFNDYTIFSLNEVIDILPGFFVTVKMSYTIILLEKVVTDIALHPHRS
jgi:hypothetical protein